MRTVKLSVAALLAATVLTGASGCGLFGNDCGWTNSRVTLKMPVDLVVRDAATAVQMCVVGGQCQTQPLVVPSWALPGTAASPTSTAGPVRPLPEMGVEFSNVLPASVTGQGSDDPPVQLTMTLFSAGKSLLTSRATLGLVNVRAGQPGTCHAKGYWIAADLSTGGTLGYDRFV